MGKSDSKILIIDDNASVHSEIRRILGYAAASSKTRHALDSAHQSIFGSSTNQEVSNAPHYIIDSAYQGQEGYEKIKAALESHEPYSVAIVDMRMPPGWDGLETIKKIWEVTPDTQILLCSAYSDHSWNQINRVLGRTDSFLILKKPFDMTELEQMVSALTVKWQLFRTNRQYIDELNQAKFEAEAGLIAKSDFLRMMNHEFRTPMNAILGTLQFIEESDDYTKDDIPMMISNAREATTGLLRILDDILDYLQMNKGNLEFSSSSYNLAVLLGQTCGYYINIAKNRNIRLEIQLGKHLNQNYLGDERRIRQVITHLVSNAIKHTSNGSICVSAYKENVSPTPKMESIVIMVTDTGEGIEEEKLDMIFESFQQGENPRIRSTRGIGLGLSICEKIVKGMKGEIQVTSKKGEGTTFKVRFLQKPEPTKSDQQAKLTS